MVLCGNISMTWVWCRAKNSTQTIYFHSCWVPHLGYEHFTHHGYCLCLMMSKTGVFRNWRRKSSARCRRLKPQKNWVVIYLKTTGHVTVPPLNPNCPTCVNTTTPCPVKPRLKTPPCRLMPVTGRSTRTSYKNSLPGWIKRNLTSVATSPNSLMRNRRKKLFLNIRWASDVICLSQHLEIWIRFHRKL